MLERSLRPRPVFAALAAILAGLTLTGSIALGGLGGTPSPSMPGTGCPPQC